MTARQVAALTAMVDRMFPAGDGLGSASELGVVDFILSEVAGPWGRGESMYLTGPFEQPADAGHGWQLPLTPAAAIAHGLDALGRLAEDRCALAFEALDPATQDELLTAVERGDAEGFVEVPAPMFFELVRGCVHEGLLSDPIHQGNRDAAVWRWMGFPGDPSPYGEPYGDLLRSDEPYAVQPRSVGDSEDGR